MFSPMVAVVILQTFIEFGEKMRQITGHSMTTIGAPDTFNWMVDIDEERVDKWTDEQKSKL
jgi:hypothetical protein